MMHLDYVQRGRCTADCACVGVYEAADCPVEPGCDRCVERIHVVGHDLPGEIFVVRLLPGETTRQAVARHLGDGYSTVGPRGYVN